MWAPFKKNLVRLLKEPTYVCFGWLLIILFMLLFILARVAFALNVQEQFYFTCKQSLINEADPQSYLNALEICDIKYRPSIDIILECDAWSYAAIYGNKHIKK